MDFGLKEALRFVKGNDKFYVRRETFQGHELHFFNYWTAGEQWFDCELALEMRGLLFVDGQRYLAQRKFFTLNQGPSTCEDLVQHKTVVEATEKVDGSLIRFVRIGGPVKAKTKMGVSNPGAQAADAILANDPVLRAVVEESLDRGVALHFEYVAPDNIIVLPYAESALILHSARDEATGEMLRLGDFARPGIKLCETILMDGRPPTFQELKARCMADKDSEGFVVRFSDGQMIKMKTQWYVTKHLQRELEEMTDFEVLECIVKDAADDLLQAAGEGLKARTLELQACWDRHLAAGCKAMRELVAAYQDDKSWFLTHGKHELFEPARKWRKRGADPQYMEAVFTEAIMQPARKNQATKQALLSRLRAEAAADAPSAGSCPTEFAELAVAMRYYHYRALC